jgi:hypothetical protein
VGAVNTSAGAELVVPEPRTPAGAGLPGAGDASRGGRATGAENSRGGALVEPLVALRFPLVPLVPWLVPLEPWVAPGMTGDGSRGGRAVGAANTNGLVDPRVDDCPGLPTNTGRGGFSREEGLDSPVWLGVFLGRSNADRSCCMEQLWLTLSSKRGNDHANVPRSS